MWYARTRRAGLGLLLLATLAGVYLGQATLEGQVGPFSAQIVRALRAYGLLTPGTFTGNVLATTTPTDCSAPQYSWQGDTDTGTGYGGANVFLLCTGGVGRAAVSNTEFQLASAHLLTWNGDTVLSRDAANTLAQRNGTNAQAFRVYNTFTDASNYERLSLLWSSNEAYVVTGAGGTGSQRNLIVGTAGATTLKILTNNSERWHFNSSGHFLAVADNTYDIGASNATRPKDIHVANEIYLGNAVRFDGLSTGQLNLLNVAATAGIGLDFSVDGLLKIRNRAQTGYSDVEAGVVTSAGDGSGFGLAAGVGGDVRWYRSAADTWRTSDAVVIDGSLTLTGSLIADGTISNTGAGAISTDRAWIFTHATLGGNVVSLSTTATNDDPTENFFQNRATTTDATVTTIQSITIATSTNTVIACYVTARRTGGSAGAAEDGAGYYIEVVMKNTAGTAAELAAETVRTIGESQAGWNVTAAPSGATELIQVTGALNNNVTWHSHCRTWPVST